MITEAKVAEMRKRIDDRRRHLAERLNFLDRVASLLASHHVTNSNDLPDDVQQSIAADAAKLMPENDFDRENAELEQMEADLLPLIAHLLPRA